MENPVVVTIFFGANDSSLKGTAFLAHSCFSWTQANTCLYVSPSREFSREQGVPGVSFGFDVVRVGSGPLGLIFHITALLAHLK